MVRLRVRNEGGGFDLENSSPASSGLHRPIGMRERAKGIGGHLMLDSARPEKEPNWWWKAL